MYCRKPKQLPSCLCTSQPHELSALAANTTYRQWSSEWIRNNSASELPGEMFCTPAYQSGSHCTPSTHIDGFNGAKLLQETSHILLSCPFVQLSYPERGTAHYNQELAQVDRAITDTSSLWTGTDKDRQPTLIPCWIQGIYQERSSEHPPQGADYCSNIEYSSRFSTWETQNGKLWQPRWQNQGKVLGAAHLRAPPGRFHWTAARALQALTPLGLSLTRSWILKHLRFLSLLYKKECFSFIWWRRRRFHTPKERSKDNYYVWSTNTGKARIVSEIQTSACVFFRSKLPFRLERYTRLNT